MSGMYALPVSIAAATEPSRGILFCKDTSDATFMEWVLSRQASLTLLLLLLVPLPLLMLLMLLLLLLPTPALQVMLKGNNVTNTDQDNKCDVNTIAGPDNLFYHRYVLHY